MIKNGTHKLSITGTLEDFFTNMKTFILDVTDFQLIQDECDTFKLAFNTNINNVKMVIKDANITSSADTATTSSTINFSFYQGNNILDSFNQSYTTSPISQSAIADRQVNLFVYVTTNVKFFNFSATTSTFEYTFGKVITSEIATKSTKNRFFIKNVFYPFDGIGTKLYLLNIFYGYQCGSGIVKNNLLLTESPSTPANIAEFCTDLYNCSAVTSKYKYTIAGEMYFAIDRNIIVRI